MPQLLFSSPDLVTSQLTIEFYDAEGNSNVQKLFIPRMQQRDVLFDFFKKNKHVVHIIAKTKKGKVIFDEFRA